MMEEEASLPFRCEYAKSARSKCKACKETIEKGVFRLAKMVKSPSFDGLIPSWFHVACFFQHPKKRGLTDAGEIEGLANARPEDQQRIRKELGGLAAASTTSKDDAVALTEEGSALVWSICESFERDPPTMASCREWLDDNGLQDDAGSRADKAYAAVASAVVYGVPPKCPDCGTQDSVRRCSSGYRCSHRGEWGPCLFASKDVTCTPFKADEALLARLPEPVKVCLVNPKPWVATSSQRGEKRKAADDDAEDDEEESGTLVWSSVKLGGVAASQKDLRTKLSPLGFSFLSTLAKTADAVVLSHGMYTPPRSVRPVLSRETLEGLGDFAAVQVAFGDEASFLKLGHPDGKDKNERLLRELWNRVHAGQPAKTQPQKRTKIADDTETGERKVKLVFKGRAAVDPSAGEEYVRDWKVSDPPGEDGPFDVVLNLADVSTGTNSYYGLQILERESGESYALFRKWGRIGSDRGSTKIEPLSSFSDAKRRFRALFYEKTDNEWESREAGNFVKRPGKFFPVQVVRAASDSTRSTDLGDGSDDVAHGLDGRVAALIAKIFDVKSIEQSLREMEIDLRKMPLGNLTKATIDEGYAVLREIESILQDSATSSSPATSEVLWKQIDSAAEELGRLAADAKMSLATRDAVRLVRKEASERMNAGLAAQRRQRSQLVALTNKFYTVVPHDFGDKAAPVLDELEKLAPKVALLDALAEVETVMSILKRGPVAGDIHPLRQKYDELRARLTPLEKDDGRLAVFETQLQDQMGNRKVRLDQVYEVDREGERERFLDLAGERALLWHGSRLTNFGGILSRGLLIAPPSAPVSGYRLGKGVYFANVAEKSIGYAAPQQGRSILLLLCEVALGKPAELLEDRYMEKAPAGFDSTHALGTLTPSKVVRRPDVGLDLDLPVGKPTHRQVRSSFLHDEYVVYDVRQVRMRFLLEMTVL